MIFIRELILLRRNAKKVINFQQIFHPAVDYVFCFVRYNKFDLKGGSYDRKTNVS
jgi:hypothetical protein